MSTRRERDNRKDLLQGTLVLRTLSTSGWVTSSWAASETNRRARFYTLTAKGRKRLAEEEEHWTRLTGAVGRVLREA